MQSPGEALDTLFLPDPVERHHPLAQGLAAWWLTLPGLDGGQYLHDLMGLTPGTLVSMGDASVNGWRGSTRPGGWGHLLYDGTAYVDCGTGPVVSSWNLFTVSAWINPSDISGIIYVRSVVAKDTSTGGRTFAFGVGGSSSGGNQKLYYETNAANDALMNGAATLSVNTWYHAAVTFDGTTYRMYQDGVQVASQAAAAPPASTSSLTIGRRNYPGFTDPFKGAIDDVRIFTRVLSAQEVFALYENSRTGCPGLLRRWRRALVSVPTGILYRSSTSTTASLAAAFSVNKPTGTADGDFLVAFECVNQGSAPSPPSGWTALDNISFSGSAANLACFVRIAASEPASWTFNGAALGTSLVWVLCFTNTTASVQEAEASNSGSSSTALATLGPGYATSQNLEMIVCAYAATGVGVTITPDQGTDLGTIGAGPYLDATYQSQAVAGAVGDKTATLDSTHPWAGIVLAIPSASGATGGILATRVILACMPPYHPIPYQE